MKVVLEKQILMLGMESKHKQNFKVWSSLHWFCLMLVFSQMYFFISDLNSSIKYPKMCVILSLDTPSWKAFLTASNSKLHCGSRVLKRLVGSRIFLLRMATQLVLEEYFFSVVVAFIIFSITLCLLTFMFLLMIQHNSEAFFVVPKLSKEG